MLRDNLVGLIEPMLSSAGAYTLALGTARKQSSDDRPPCLENPRPEGAESTLTENVASPFQAEPTQGGHITHFQIERVIGPEPSLLHSKHEQTQGCRGHALGVLVEKPSHLSSEYGCLVHKTN